MGPRNYFKADFYTKPDCNFYSEIGTVGCPNISSIKKFISPDKLWPWDNNEYYAHTTADSKTDNYTFYLTLLEDGIKENFDRVPDNLEDFVIASQIGQAEAFGRNFITASYPMFFQESLHTIISKGHKNQ